MASSEIDDLLSGPLVTWVSFFFSKILLFVYAINYVFLNNY